MDKALEGIPLNKKDLLCLLSINDTRSLEILYKTANYLRHKHLKNSCCVHGIIEISNYCSQNCSYCGISKKNKKLLRYRMSPEEIINTAVEATEKYGFKALVLQSGEDSFYDTDGLVKIVKKIKQRANTLICISFGEVGVPGLKQLYKAGARALLMRFETSNPKIYQKLHPGRNLNTRLLHLKEAQKLGYLIMTGGLIGLPNQTNEDIINDIYLTKELKAEMYSFGPFLPGPNTPLAKKLPPKSENVLKTLAIARLVDPKNAKILITTAFETLSKQARKKGLLAGGNSVMINVTPIKYRKNYSIYPNRANNTKKINTQIQKTLNLLKSLGRAPTDLGM